MELSQNNGYLLGCPQNKDDSILGSVLGYPYFGKLPFIVSQKLRELTEYKYDCMGDKSLLKYGVAVK